MKKICLFIVLSVSLLSGCTHVEAGSLGVDRVVVESYGSLRVHKFHYGGHSYIMFNAPQNFKSIVHSPSCPNCTFTRR